MVSGNAFWFPYYTQNDIKQSLHIPDIFNNTCTQFYFMKPKTELISRWAFINLPTEENNPVNNRTRKIWTQHTDIWSSMVGMAMVNPEIQRKLQHQTDIPQH